MKLFPKSNKDLKEKLKKQEAIKKHQKKLIDEMDKKIEEKKKAIRDILKTFNTL